MVRILSPGSHAGQVDHSGDVVLILDEGCDLQGALVDLGTSRPKRDADEVRTDILLFEAYPSSFTKLNVSSAI